MPSNRALRMQQIVLLSLLFGPLFLTCLVNWIYGIEVQQRTRCNAQYLVIIVSFFFYIYNIYCNKKKIHFAHKKKLSASDDKCRFQWTRGLRRRSAAARLLRSWVRIPPGDMDVCCECCQIEVSATSWSLVHRSPTDCGASLCVI